MLRTLLLFAFVIAATVLAFSCLDRPGARPDRGTAAGAQTISIPTTDELELNARLWVRDPRRVVIYLHEYGDDQTSWWPTADDGTPTDPSAITFDFRGHGASAGRHDDVASAPDDVRAALAFAAQRGYQRVVLVGSGMGAAAAIEASVDAPAVGVLGLSAPIEFAEMRPIETVGRMTTRTALIATEGDLSAQHSLGQFRTRTAIPAGRLVQLKGADHGQAMLTGTRAPEAQAALQRLIKELWQP